MPKQQGIVGIGLKVDYEKALQQMNGDFQKALTKISNNAKKIGFDADIKSQIKQVNDDMAAMSENFKRKFEEINSQTINAENFEKYQEKVSKSFSEIKASISGITDQIADLNQKVGLLDGADTAAKMKAQFDEWSQSILATQKELKQVVDITKSMGGSPKLSESSTKDFKETLEVIKRVRKETEELTFDGISEESLNSNLEKHYNFLQENIEAYKQLRKEVSGMSKEDAGYVEKTNELRRYSALLYEAYDALAKLDAIREDRTGVYSSKYNDLIDTLDRTYNMSGMDSMLENWENGIKKILQKSKAASEQIQGTFDTFRVKDGAILIPIDIATKSSELKDKIRDIIQELKTYAEKTPVVAKVKLTLDKSSSTGYEKNSEVDKQQVEGQNEPAIDITKAIQKTYRDAAREAKQIVKTEIKTIQEEFENVPIKIKPDTDAFTKDLKKMINSSFKQISEETSGVKVNEELEKLVSNLKEVSASLSGNESFKLGLDEASIERITDAIQNMADMIQRAFGVASNDDITAQWGVIESKFKAVAGEEGKLLKGNKDHKAVIQELAVEYKKYLDMGGKNDLSELTAHKQTVKNITAEYENLGKAAQEAAQKQEKVNKKPASTKVSSEEAEAIKGVTKQNKNLETQAGKTGTALDNESKVAQTAAERFTELAEKKKAATDANLELGIAAEMTTKALKEETAALKEAEQRKKTNKKTVDEGTYESNASTWQKNIKQSLLDGGNYLEVYDGKLSRLESGTVRYTAFVKDSAEDSEESWKKLTATISSTGEIQSTKLQDITKKQFLKMEKEKQDVARMLEQADGEEVEPMRLNRDELERYANDVKSILKGLEKSKKATYTVNLGSDGKLSITRKEISKTGAEVKSFTAVIDNVEDVFNNTSEGMVVSARKLKEALKSAFDNGNISKSTKDLAASARKAFDVFKEKAVRDGNFSAIEDDLEKLRLQIANIKTSKDLIKFNQDLKDLGVTLKNVSKDNKLGEIIGGNKTFKDINEVRANIDSLFASMGKVNEKSIRVKGTDKLTAEIKAANGEIRMMTVSLDSNNFARFVDNGIVEFGRLRAAAEGVFKGIQSMVRIYLSPSDFIRYFRQGFDAVKEIDTAMTELKKVSDASPQAITAYFGDAVASAKELGSSVNEMIGATADWQRMGYNLPDSRELGEVAILYKNVGDGIDVDTANESLVSTMQGFQLQAKDAMSVIDAFNEVSNNYAISSAGIGEALKRSAAAFNAANTDLNQSIALITAGNEIVQSPEKVGTMWQTVSARIRGKFLCPLHSNMQTAYEDNIKVA